APICDFATRRRQGRRGHRPVLLPWENRPFFCLARQFLLSTALTLLAQLLRIVTRNAAFVRKTRLFDLRTGRICRVSSADIAHAWAKFSPCGALFDAQGQDDFSRNRKIDV